MKALSTQIFIAFTALVLTAVNFIFFGALWQYFMIHAFDFWYKVFKIYPIFEQTRTEMFIINLFPIVVAVFLLKWRIKRSFEGMISFCYAYFSVFVATLLGSFFSIFLFGRIGIDPLLPDEFRSAPFPFYWLVFVVLGIAVFLLILRRKYNVPRAV
jgi:hypothetical protein